MTLIMTFFTEWKSEVAYSNMKNRVSNKVGEKYFIAQKNTTT